MNKFVIGIGSQRAGSTLLHKILVEATSIYMHPLKEIHYYDTIYEVRKLKVLRSYLRDQLSREVKKIIDSSSHAYIDKRVKNYLHSSWLMFNNDIENINYLDLFRPCVRENFLLGEITPEYMILPEEGIRRMLQDVGEDARIILLARDPVDRLISSYKLLKRYRSSNGNIDNADEEIQWHISNDTEWIKQQDLLNDYSLAYKKYKKYFSYVKVFFYEDMFKKPSYFAAELEGFLDEKVSHDALKEMVGNKVNSLGEEVAVSDYTKRLLAERYASSIEFVKKLKVFP